MKYIFEFILYTFVLGPYCISPHLLYCIWWFHLHFQLAGHTFFYFVIFYFFGKYRNRENLLFYWASEIIFLLNMWEWKLFLHVGLIRTYVADLFHFLFQLCFVIVEQYSFYSRIKITKNIQEISPKYLFSPSCF